MKRPPRLFREERATHAELLEHIQQWREYACYLEGRLGIVDTGPVAATARKAAAKKKTAAPTSSAEMFARGLMKLLEEGPTT